MPMLLSDIIKLAGECEVVNFTDDIAIEAIENDNRKNLDSALFIAMAGASYDSHRHLPDVVGKGAVAVVAEKPVDPARVRVPILRVPSSFEFTRKIAAAFYGYPSTRLVLAGITGTNGKTTTSYFLRSVLSQKYGDCGLIGTIKYYAGSEVFDAPNTSPEPLFFQGLLAKMIDSGLESAVMEVSSHAIKLGRIENTEYDFMIFTNLSKEHTEFHPDMEDYYRTKAGAVLRALASGAAGKKGRAAIVNCDDGYGRRLIGELSAYGDRVFTYSAAGGRADLRATEIKVRPEGVSFQMEYGGFSVPVFLRMTGVFNVYNALAAAACGLCDGLTLCEVKAGLEYIPSVPGRFERVDYRLPDGRSPEFSVFVDFAHTPEGVANLLDLARSFAAGGRVITVMGCGGDRSREKRPLMGFNAASKSDLTIVTSDNPRTEDPVRIINDIMPGVMEAGGNHAVEPDRASAISRAVSLAGSGDIVLIVGKGHENYQIIGTKKYDFDDRAVALDALEKRFGSGVQSGRKIKE